MFKFENYLNRYLLSACQELKLFRAKDQLGSTSIYFLVWHVKQTSKELQQIMRDILMENFTALEVGAEGIDAIQSVGEGLFRRNVYVDS